jgi:integrase
VKEWLNEWLDTYIKPPCRKENTYLCYKYTINIILKLRPEIRDLGIKEINELYIQKILKEATISYSKSTIKKIKTVFKEAYTVAIRNQMCKDNPALSLTIPEEAHEKEIRALTREEELRVMEAAKKDVLGHLAIFMLKTGIRSCELRSLKWVDYDAEKGEIYIKKSKTPNGVRVVPLLSDAKKIIDSQPHYCEYIFTSTTKKPITKTVLRRLYERLRKATGIDIITNHVYRHSFATRAIEKKIDYKALSKILGHKDVAFTLRRYTNAETSFLHEQMNLLEKTSSKRCLRFKFIQKSTNRTR